MSRPPLVWAAYGIMPTLGVIAQLKRGVSHRDALRYIHDHRGMLNRYHMIVYAGQIRQDRDWMLSLCRHFRKTGV